MLFGKDKNYDFLLVCLGNPGKEYELTRHNAGFLFAHWLAEVKGVKIKRVKYQAFYGDIKFDDLRGLVIMPLTYMNLSGEAVKSYADSYGFEPDQILVVVDDINFEVGAMRVRKKGSAGGHNGLKSIISSIGSEDFPRIRLGVGAKSEGEDLKDHVLSDFSRSELQTLDKLYECVYDAADLILHGKPDIAMQKYNGTSKQKE